MSFIFQGQLIVLSVWVTMTPSPPCVPPKHAGLLPLEWVSKENLIYLQRGSGRITPCGMKFLDGCYLRMLASVPSSNYSMFTRFKLNGTFVNNYFAVQLFAEITKVFSRRASSRFVALLHVTFEDILYNGFLNETFILQHIFHEWPN